MASILIRNLDDLIVERLRARARLKGISLEEEARRILADGTRMSRQEFFARAAALRAAQRPHRSRAVDLIREDRDR